PTARPAARGRNWPAGRAARCAARRRPRRPLAPGQAARGSGSLRQTPCRCRTGRPRVRAPSARRVSSPVPERFGFRRVSCGVPRVNLTSVRTLSPLRTLVVTVLALLLIAAVPATAKAPRKVPAAFMGVVGDGPLLYDSSVDLPNQFDRMVGNGVQTLRLMFNWSQAQPYQSFDQVPPDQRDRYRDENGVPTDYALMDQVVTASATRHIALLPEVQ